MRRPFLILGTLALLLVVVVVATVFAPRRMPRLRPVPADTSTAHRPGAFGPAPDSARLTHPEVGFRSRSALLEHFRKHGAEVDARDPAAYLTMAQGLRDRPAGGTVLELRRRDGVITRFDRVSGAFIAFDRDLTIRTFFRPNDGELYFRRQLDREH